MNNERKEEAKIVEHMFLYYCEVIGRDPKRYTLTGERRKKALLRLRERYKIHGSLDAAAAEIAQAIQNLAASDYHVAKGYTDWLEQIFRSAEEFEKRLNWQEPQGATHANNGNFESKNARIVREALAEFNNCPIGNDGGSAPGYFTR